MKYLVTGAAGFIGLHVVSQLINDGNIVVGVDNINDYYDVQLKYARLESVGVKKEDIIEGKLAQSNKFPNYSFVKLNLDKKDKVSNLFRQNSFDVVCHLAAQAGIRYSIENPYAYLTNITAFLSVLEGCRNYGVKHLVFASSSSIYGMNKKVPFSEEDRVDQPVSLYAATKKADEMMAYTYNYLYHIPITGLRFFTVYGPWGRPDMAPMLFANAITSGKPIKVFNNGDLYRDFTFVDDIAEGVFAVLNQGPKNPYNIYNIGCSNPIKIMDFITCLEQSLGRKAELNMLPMQPGDVYQTYSDSSKLARDYGYKPCTTLNDGITKFVKWYEQYFNL